MNLLLDENLSDRIIPRILDLYPGSTHVKIQGLMHEDDSVIWEFAKAGAYIIVSKDWDFHQLSLLRGFPPKVIYLDVGNGPTSHIVDILRENFSAVQTFQADSLESLLILG